MDEGRADVNRETRWRKIPLVIACLAGEEGVVKLLLEAGADVEVENEWGETPLVIAQNFGWDGIVELLTQRGATEKAPVE